MGISSEARSPRTRWLLCALLALAWTNGGVHAQPHAGATAPSLAGIWVFDGSPSFPGPRYLRITTAAGPAKGTLTTDWYGDLPMNKLRIEGGVAHFEIDNGNPRLPPKPWTATLAGGSLRVVGDIWSTHVDIEGRRGGEADAQRLAFRPASLPLPQKLAPDGQAPTPPMGWSSWNKFAEHIDDKTIRGIADALVSSGLRDAGYVYVNIDDGWQGRRDAHDVWRGAAIQDGERSFKVPAHGVVLLRLSRVGSG